MLPNSTNSLLFHSPIGLLQQCVLPSSDTVESLNVRVNMCIKAGAEAAEPQSRNPSKMQDHCTATRCALAA